MDVDSPGKGKKKATEDAMQEDAEDIDADTGEGDPTPCKVTTPAAHPPFSVVVEAPPSPHPKWCMRINEEGDAAIPPPPPVPAPRKLWVGKDEVCHITHCIMSESLIHYVGQMSRVH
jgi:hypothetical protein